MINIKNYTILKDLKFLRDLGYNTNNLIYLGLKPLEKIYDINKKKEFQFINKNEFKINPNNYSVYDPNNILNFQQTYLYLDPLQFWCYEGFELYKKIRKSIDELSKIYEMRYAFDMSHLTDLYKIIFNGIFFGKTVNDREYLIAVKYIDREIFEFTLCELDKKTGYVGYYEQKNNILGYDCLSHDVCLLLWLYKKNLNEIKYIETTDNAYKKGITKNKTHIKTFTELNYTSIIRDQAFDVKGHWRKQKCGIGRSEEKLIFIESFQKTGYKRFIKSA